MFLYKKTAIAFALSSTAALSGVAHAAQISAAGYAMESSANTTGNNISVLDNTTGGFNGGSNTVGMTWDGTVFTSSSDYTGPGSTSNMTLSLPGGPYFFSFFWTAHDIQVFAPGTYTFDTTLGGGGVDTGMQTLTVGAGQLGAHMLLDFNLNPQTPCRTGDACNLDVSILWAANGVFGNNSQQQTLTGTAIWNAVSIDGDGNGVPGIATNAGSTAGFGNWAFNVNLNGITPVPLPGAVWLLGSGLLGLLGVAKRKKPGAQ